MGEFRWTQAEVCYATRGLHAIRGRPNTLSITHHLRIVARGVAIGAVIVSSVSKQLVALVGLSVINGRWRSTGSGDALGRAVTPFTTW